MGPTRTRYAYGSACAYRMTTACSGAIEESAVAIADQTCSNLGSAVPPIFGDSPAARGKR